MRPDEADRPATVVGVFDYRNQLQSALAELGRAGFREEQVGVAMRGASVEGGPMGTVNISEVGPNARESAVRGAVSGGLWRWNCDHEKLDGCRGLPQSGAG